MPECPDCHTNNVQSKGYRTKGVHRYLCNECGRNFTVDNRLKIELPQKLQEEVTEAEGFNRKDWQKEYHNKNTTITIGKDTKEWLESLKNYDAEPINSVLIRIMKGQAKV